MIKIPDYVIAFVFIISFIFVITGVEYFYIGFHNVDLSYNMALIVNDYNQQGDGLIDYRDAGDIAGGDKMMSYVELYNIGLKQMKYSQRLLIFAFFGLLVVASLLFLRLWQGIGSEAIY